MHATQHRSIYVSATDRDPVKNESQKLKPFNFYMHVKNTFYPGITLFGVITQF